MPIPRDSYLWQVRQEFSASLALPRLVERPRCEFDKRMAEHWCQHARDLGRPGYNEAPGFTYERPGASFNAKGREQAYGPFSRTHWRYVWLAMRAAWWSGWNEAVGTTYKTNDIQDSRAFALITGVTT